MYNECPNNSVRLLRKTRKSLKRYLAVCSCISKVLCVLLQVSSAVAVDSTAVCIATQTNTTARLTIRSWHKRKYAKPILLLLERSCKRSRLTSTALFLLSLTVDRHACFAGTMLLSRGHYWCQMPTPKRQLITV